ncbi:hypothetical protein M5C72_01165 [Companilactobacillus allii]|uniref:Uncharacterized protein n=1 Tax=Companilactobacillus allii TaxID=1847728 RepID=A0A1P8Q1N0_9LACO|nr:hypothetical protein [Companilactobacillus allii]APX71784.1 hypothetical protein BTM29_04100 [Companilactobacillus allii]USQ68872.1 hypothetical protein M5C72_01165 [Companilactobacillus allii]
MRQERYHKKSHKKAIWITLITILVLIVLGIVFFFPLNNAVRNISGGNDTPSDKVVKSELVKKVSSTKNGNAKHDANVEKAATALKATKMSTIVNSANNESDAAKLLQKNSTLSSSESKAAAKTIFSDSKYDGLRQAVSSGNWYSAYNQYKTLSNDGSLTSLRDSISNK